MKLILLDLDRTLFDSDRFYVDMCKVLAKEGMIEHSVLEQAIAELESEQRSLYMGSLIKQLNLDKNKVLRILRRHIKADNTYLYPDVEPFLKHYKTQRIVIITTGSALYQELKFDLSPRLGNYHHQIIDELDKGAYIKRQLRFQNEQLSLGTITAGEWFEELYFVDDRAYNFSSLTALKHAKLFHILRPGGKYTPPAHAPVIRIISLKEVQ